MTDSTKSLLIFIIVLAITGAAIGGIYYTAVELPQQKALEESQPENRPNIPTYPDHPFDRCMKNCELLGGSEDSCRLECNDRYYSDE